MYSVYDTAEAVGFPIRKSTDQSLFAAPRGLTQRTTSFIASQRQGIHQMPLSRLIVLIINAHQVARQPSAEEDEPVFIEKRPEFYSVQRFVCRHVRSSNAGRRRSNPLQVAVDQTNPFIHDVKS